MPDGEHLCRKLLHRLTCLHVKMYCLDVPLWMIQLKHWSMTYSKSSFINFPLLVMKLNAEWKLADIATLLSELFRRLAPTSPMCKILFWFHEDVGSWHCERNSLEVWLSSPSLPPHSPFSLSSWYLSCPYRKRTEDAKVVSKISNNTYLWSQQTVPESLNYGAHLK